MDSGFDENEPKFTILVFAIALKMLADGDGLTFISAILPLVTEEIKGNGTELGRCYLLDQHVQVLWNLWCKACHVGITPSVIDQAEAMSCRIAAETSP